MNQPFHGSKEGHVVGERAVKHPSQPKWDGPEGHDDRVSQRHRREGFSIPQTIGCFWRGPVTQHQPAGQDRKKRGRKEGDERHLHII